MLAIVFFTNLFFVHVFAMDMQIRGGSQDMSMYATESRSTQTITITNYPIATIEVQYNSLYISDAIDVTQYLTITTFQSWKGPTVSTAAQPGNTSASVSTDALRSKNATSMSTSSQYLNESVSELYQQPTLPISTSTQNSNINQSYPSFLSAKNTTGWTNASSSSGTMVISSLIVDHSSAPTPKFSPPSSSTAKPYTLAGSGVRARRNAFSISFQLWIVLMQILLAY